jgi:6-phosphogluconolactonase
MNLRAALALFATMLTANAAETPFYVGCYTKPGGAKGIYLYQLDLDTGKVSGGALVAEAQNPSFLAVHPSGDFLYAVSENGEGSVAAYAIQDDGTLKVLNTQPAKGSGPCHISVDGSGKNAFVANYGSGSIAALPIKEDGSLSPASAFIQHTGKSVDPQRQEGPHAHSVYADESEKFLYACDLGLDKVFIYKLDVDKGTLTPATPPSASVPPGSGPRHFAFHPDGGYAYAINEMASTVTAFKHNADTGALEPMQNISTLPSDFKGTSSTAEVFIHPNGRFLYGSNRGHDSIATFAIDEKTGQLKPLGHTPTGGKTPRGFAIDPTGMWLIAGNQDSDNFIVLKIDPSTGKLTPTGQSLSVGMPVSFIFPPRK